MQTEPPAPAARGGESQASARHGAPAVLPPVRNKILGETLSLLEREHGPLPAIRQLSLSRYFTTVTLADGSVGSCMSYYSAPDDDLRAAETSLAEFLAGDPLRIAMLDTPGSLPAAIAGQLHDLQSSVLATIVSAASRPFLQSGGHRGFTVSATRPDSWFTQADAALVVGFGGFLGNLCNCQNIGWVHLIDLGYPTRRDAIEAYLEPFRRRFPRRRFTAASAVQHDRTMRSFDLACVTGSTLSNDTLAGFLDRKAEGSRLILQGQSASIYPRVLFAAGVDGIATTIKPPQLSGLAQTCFSGDRLRPYLEGNLPWIYITPTPDSDSAPLRRPFWKFFSRNS
jgi:hypothetical protein